MRRAPWLRLGGALLAGSLLLAACGAGDDDDDASSGGTGETTETSGGSEATGGGEPETAPGFDGTTIKLGVLTPLTGLVSVIGLPLTAGNELWFNYLNQELGGIAGKYKVELVTADTEYSPDVAVQEYNKQKSEVAAFLQVLGTPVTNALLPQLNRDGKLASPASLDAEWIQEENLLPLSGPYQIQMINGADWYVAEGGGEGKKACALIQDDAYGEAGLEGVNVAAEEQGFEVAVVAKYKAGAPDFTAQIQQLVDGKCEVVYGVLLASDTSKALGKAAELSFAPQWILQSPAWLDLFTGTGLVDYLEKNVLVLAAGPAWKDETVPGMRDLVARKEQFGPSEYDGNLYFSYGYNQGRAMTEVLEKAVELGDLSPEGIIEASNSLGTVSFDGLDGDYTYGPPEDRDPSRVTSVLKVNRALPFGLEIVEQDYTSDAAESYEFSD